MSTKEPISEICLGFRHFKEACKNATCVNVRPYGLYHKGEVYWDPKLHLKEGTAVRYFEDTSGPCTSLVVLTLDGEFLCNAWPPSWHENDHPAQKEMQRWIDSLSQQELEDMLQGFEES